MILFEMVGDRTCLSAETLRQRGSKIGQVLQYQRIVGLFLLFLVGVKEAQSENLGDLVKIYGLGGRRVTTSDTPHGIYIVKDANGSRNVLK